MIEELHKVSLVSAGSRQKDIFCDAAFQKYTGQDSEGMLVLRLVLFLFLFEFT